jgi:hypothetical protein
VNEKVGNNISCVFVDDKKSTIEGQEKLQLKNVTDEIKSQTCTPAACLLVEKNFSAVKVLVPSALVV